MEEHKKKKKLSRVHCGNCDYCSLDNRDFPCVCCGLPEYRMWKLAQSLVDTFEDPRACAKMDGEIHEER